MKITGKVITITEVEQITDTFKKANLILGTDGDTQYPQEVCIEVHNAVIDKLKDVSPGDVVSVDCNLRGRRYEKSGQDTRWFNTIAMWKIEVITKSDAPVDENGDAPF